MENDKFQMTNDKLNPKSQNYKPFGTFGFRYSNLFRILILGFSIYLVFLVGGCAPKPKALPQEHIHHPGMIMEEVTPKETEANMVKLSKEEEDLIGVRTEAAQYRKLTKELRVVGTVAYDPDLFVAQEELLGAVKLGDESIIEASRKKLQILGMGKEQIMELEKKEEADSSLLLPEGSVWVYADFYEYEAPWLKSGQKAGIKTAAAPEKEFQGEIAAIEPIVKDMTRTLKARLKVDNSDLILKPNMYVDVYLRAELSQSVLSVPAEAVLDTGMRKLVYVAKGEGIYVGREVKVGPEASGYVPIIAGLSEGDRVVSKANFLIDSQSKLTGGASALYGSSAKEIKTKHKH